MIFNKPLESGWGLTALTQAGEAWLPVMLERDASGGAEEGSDEHVTKLFEFLVAAICL